MGINQDQVAFQRTGDDLNFAVGGLDDQVVVKNWYKGNGANKIESVVFGDGSVLTSGQIDSLIAAMASSSGHSLEPSFTPLLPQSTISLTHT
ncbi:calcium-binding protein [Lysobacter gummosus]|uniref:calcium-binding protein n=1 Tax=Lysobacter gummosus TaxID=262324 RepID=UPI00363E154B